MALWARESARYMVPAALVWASVFVAALTLGPLWRFALVAVTLPWLVILWFFRDPERTPGEGIVSPADGKVLSTESTTAYNRLIIFMSPTSVHVNRSPLDGRVERTEYRQGAHKPAFSKESEHNERFDLTLDSERGPVQVALIAGSLARRIHPYVSPGAQLKKGQRIGLIAFGSRCELTLQPGPVEWKVRPGQWIKAGETTVAS